MKIEATKDYKTFKHASFNRELSNSNLKKLIKLNQKKNRLHLFPIIVDKNFVVIDGQHRLAACIELGCPVHYLVDEMTEATPSEIYDLNIAGKKHRVHDKILMLSKSGNNFATRVIRMWEAEKRMSLTSTLETLYTLEGLSALDKLEKMDAFDPIGVKIHELVSHLPVKSITSRSIRAIVHIAKNYDVDTRELVIRIARNWKMVNDAGTEKFMVMEFIKAYNHGLAHKNKLSIIL